MTRRASRYAITAIAALVLPLAACGESDTADDTPAAPSGRACPTVESAVDGLDDGFPVTIEHAFGSTEIDAEPQRVVTVGWSSSDTATALGTTPVAIPVDSFAGGDDGVTPWLEEAIADAGGEVPPTYVDMPELDIDAVIDAEPDLIIATHSGIDQAVFDQLSGVAPTVAYPGDPWLTTWQAQTELTAASLGKASEGTRLVSELDDLLAEKAEEYPQFAGKTFAYVFAAEGNQLSVYLPGDARVCVLESLGFVIPDYVKSLEPAPGSFYATISLEQVDKLADVDVLFTWFNNEDEKDELESNELFATLPAFQEGRYLPLLDPEIAAATSAVSTLSLPWALDSWLPTVADAVGE